MQEWAIAHNVRIGADLTKIQIKELVGLTPPLERPRIPKKSRPPPQQEQLGRKLLEIQEQLRELKAHVKKAESQEQLRELEARVKKLESQEKGFLDLLVFIYAIEYLEKPPAHRHRLVVIRSAFAGH